MSKLRCLLIFLGLSFWDDGPVAFKGSFFLDWSDEVSHISHACYQKWGLRNMNHIVVSANPTNSSK